MDKVWIMARKDIRETLRSKMTYIYALFFFFISISFANTFKAVIDQLTSTNASATDIRQGMQLLMDNAVYTLPLIIAMLFSSFLSTYTVVIDKARRTLESLLATPMSLGQLWAGKSLSVVLPSIALAWLLVLVGFPVLNIFLIKPAAGFWVFPSPIALVVLLVVMPVFLFSVVMLITFFQLTVSNPRIVNLAYLPVFGGVFYLAVRASGSGQNMTLYFCMVTALILLVVMFMRRFKVKERVVLSSKGQ